MQTAELVAYFDAERQGGFLLVLLAIVSVGFAALLWYGRSAFVHMVWPLLVLGLFQVVVGVAVALRTPNQVAALEQGLRQSHVQVVAAERERMRTVNRNFGIVKVAEAVCIVLGLVLVFSLPLASAWSSVGLGLLLEGAVLLVFDAFAHQRAAVYTNWLFAV